jgi:Cytochrome b(N-terminal)/b6/petB
MEISAPHHSASLAAGGMNSPGAFVHWSIFTVSVANLVLIAVMVVIFGAALLLPFPGRSQAAGAALDGGGDGGGGGPGPAGQAAAGGDPEDDRMWTARVRRGVLRVLPPGKLLPDRQPAYVASWIYVFGVASLAALGMAIVSGFALAVGGPDWWHYNSVGHFFNSMHLWSVELFMALLVIHLWGKFWMAAWRGRRTMTWITGVVAFAASVVECFTGYLSQQNFDSQWISTSGKDAFNSVGIGAFFSVTNFGQMLMWHIVLLPVVLVAIVGAHVLLVRMRGVVHPIDAHAAPGRGGRERRRAVARADAAPWRGPTRRYDILKEGTIAAAVIVALTLGLSGLLSSPDVPPVTVATWARLAPADFLATAASELNGTSETATYGPPYNNQTASAQRLLFSPADIVGITQPVNAARDFVIGPLATQPATTPALAAALTRYRSAPAAQRVSWASAYAKAVTKVRFPGGRPVVPAASDGPVPVLLASELTLARSGALDADLLAQQPFYGSDFTKPLLFIEDGSYFVSKATAMGLTGSQWGVMNETGSYPGQPWLWLYTLWYQVPGWTNSANIDMIAIYMTGLATLALLLIPFIPGLRDIPRLIPVHRLIWHSSAGPAPRPAAYNSGPARGSGPGSVTAAGSSGSEETAPAEAAEPEAGPAEPRP